MEQKERLRATGNVRNTPCLKAFATCSAREWI
jgi:hypothetical protein